MDGPIFRRPCPAHSRPERVYVSTSDGSDENDGLSPLTPKEHLDAALSLIRDGHPDWLLLKRGDVWEDESLVVMASGLSPAQPFLISTYGNSPQRPLIRSGTQSGVVFAPFRISDFVAIQDIDFEAHLRNPAHPSYDPTQPFFDENAGLAATQDGGTFLLVEGCRFRFYPSGIVTQSIGTEIFTDIAIRRNVITESYGAVGYGSGLYVSHAENILIEENVFDLNGALPSAGVIGTMFDHSIYLQNGTVGPGTVVRGNLISRGDGIQMREGGVAENNLFARTWIALLCGGGNEGNPNGVNCRIQNNVITEGTDINDVDLRGWGFSFNNVHQGPSLVEGNIIANNSLSGFPIGAVITGNSFDDDGTPMVVDDITFRDNIIHNWRGSAMLFQGNADVVRNVLLEDNTIQGWDFDAAITHFDFGGGANNTDSMTSAGNRLSNPIASTAVCSIDFVPVDFAVWQTMVGDTTSTVGTPSFPDATRSIARYNQEVLGQTLSYEDLLAEAHQQRRGYWRPQFTAVAINAWIQQGFGVGRVFEDGFESGNTTSWATTP